MAQRDYLDAPDIGYVLLPEYAGKLATTRSENENSSRVLEKLGMRQVGTVHATDAGRELLLFSIELNPG